jgi:hypothetical protein
MPGVASGTFSAPSHEYPSYLSLRLTARDSGGLERTVSVRLDPRAVNLRFETVPAGLQLALGSEGFAAPATRTVIVGSANSMSAPSPQSLGGARYEFVSWSNNGGQTQVATAPATPTTYRATFRAIPLGETVLLADDFGDDSLNTTNWHVDNLFSGYEDPAIPVSEMNQRVQIGPLASNGGGSHFNGITSARAYGFRSGYAYVELVQPATAAGVTYSMFVVGMDSTNNYRWYVSGGRMYAQSNIGGVKVDLATFPHDPVVHRFWRIREVAGRVEFHTAPGTGGVPGPWTRRAAAPWSGAVPLGSLKFEIKAGTLDPHANPGTAIFDTFRAAVPGTDNEAPSVRLTAPANGMTYTAPAAVTLQSAASDADGTVTQVAFYHGSSLIGTDRTAPYAFSWTNVPAGNYSVTAVARDNAAATKTSSPVKVVVNSPSGETVLLADTFNDDVLSANWNVDNLFSGYEDPAIQVRETNQRVQIGPLAGNASGSHFNGISSARGYGFRTGYAYVELVQPARTAGVTYSMFVVGINSTNNYRWYVSAGRLYAQSNIGGVKMDVATFPYDPVAHRFWRIREVAGRVEFHTAPGTGGVPGAWTRRAAAPWSGAIPLGSLKFEMKAGTLDPHANPGTAIFDTFRAAVPGTP